MRKKKKKNNSTSDGLTKLILECRVPEGAIDIGILEIRNDCTKTKEIVFNCNNCNIILFLCYIKNYFETLNIFINLYKFYYI